MIFYQETEFSVAFLFGTTAQRLVRAAPRVYVWSSHFHWSAATSSPDSLMPNSFQAALLLPVLSANFSFETLVIWGTQWQNKVSVPIFVLHICTNSPASAGSHALYSWKTSFNTMHWRKKETCKHTPELVSSEYEEADSISGWSVWT